MLTEIVRDHAFTIAWFGLMTMVWLGWAQEDAEQGWRVWLGVGSVIGIGLAVGFGVVTAQNWAGESAMDGRFHWFGLLVAVEVLAAGLGCLLLARRGASTWMAWWVAMVVALHFVPLALLLDDASIAAIGIVQALGLVGMVGAVRRSGRPSSRLVGPWMGVTLLAYAVVSAVVFAQR